NAGSKTVNDVDWKQKAGKLDFLDEQGWVFLGDAQKANPWNLDLAYGYTGLGENFHLQNTKVRQLVGGSKAANDAFLSDAEKAVLNAIQCNVNMTTYNAFEPPDSYGLFALLQGVSRDYPDIGYMWRQKLFNGAVQHRFILPQAPFPQGRQMDASVLR